MRVRPFLLFAIVTACADARTRAIDDLHGVKLAPVHAKPEFTLEDTDGHPFDFRSATHGDATLLYFGYTYCPDVCPQQLSNIAAALRRLPAEDQTRIRVVFVTTDPARDTPDRLRSWLNNFDKRFIGLRGNLQDVNQIQAGLGLPPATMEQMPGMQPGPRIATYGIGHAAQVLAFTPDDSLRAEYPNGFSIGDWASDLPKLLKITNR